MKVLYGTKDKNIDVTDICYKKLMKDDIIRITCNDEVRAKIFTDPCWQVLKSIFIIKDVDQDMLEYDSVTDIYIDTNTNEIYTKNIPDYILSKYIYDTKLKDIHSKLKIGYGSFQDEYPEQIMAVRCLTGNEKVLEIGSNIGRNSLVINYILSEKGNNNNFVTLESDTNTAKILTYNRDLNKFNFHVENAALSARNLIQRGWNTICSDVLLEGYEKVNTITLEELNKKYNIQFDTLVLDCEGAFYYILMDTPEILNNINLIIMENDYHDINHKKYIDEILIKNNFYVEYSENGCELAKQIFPQTYDNFYEIWKRR
jgi:FkbM family methyltransferase